MGYALKEEFVELYGSRIGSVLEVGQSHAELVVDPQAGNADSFNDVGSFAVIENNDVGILARLAGVRSSASDSEHVSAGEQIATVRLLATVNFTTGVVTPGVARAPVVGQGVYYASAGLVQRALGLPEADSGQLTVDLGLLTGESGAEFNPTPEMLIGSHCAVLGTTGGGKSWSLAKIIEELSKFNSKVILFDATGEFRSLKNGVKHVHIGKSERDSEFSTEVALPYYQLIESDLFAIFRPRGQSQAPKLRAAIRSLKLAHLAPHIALDGMVMKANRPKVDYEAAYREYHEEVEGPYLNFDITRLSQQIENECVVPNRSAVEQQFWGGINSSEVSDCLSLVARVSDAVQSENLSPVFNPGNLPSLFETMAEFIKDDENRILRVSLEHLSFEHGAREIIANALGRRLLELSRKDVFRKKPLLVALDEAHQFLARGLEDANNDFPLDSFALIAKEGRKYALNICLATQRPRDIPEDVLSQIGTFVVHRLINHFDRGVIERASAELDHSAVEQIPVLTPGEAVVFGVRFALPLSVRVSPPECKPISSGPDFQSFWK